MFNQFQAPYRHIIYLGIFLNITNLNSLAIKGDDVPTKTMIPGLGRTVRSQHDLPRYMSVQTIKTGSHQYHHAQTH